MRGRDLPIFVLFKEPVHRSGFSFSNFLKLSSSGSDLDHVFMGLSGIFQSLELSRRDFEPWLHYSLALALGKPPSLCKPQPSLPPTPALNGDNLIGDGRGENRVGGSHQNTSKSMKHHIRLFVQDCESTSCTFSTKRFCGQTFHICSTP